MTNAYIERRHFDYWHGNIQFDRRREEVKQWLYGHEAPRQGNEHDVSFYLLAALIGIACGSLVIYALQNAPSWKFAAVTPVMAQQADYVWKGFYRTRPAGSALGNPRAYFPYFYSPRI